MAINKLDQQIVAAFNKGAQDYCSGISSLRCPYTDRNQACAWRQGWDDTRDLYKNLAQKNEKALARRQSRAKIAAVIALAVIAILSLVILAFTAAEAAEYRVIDGDSIEYQGVEYRFWGIDAPEYNQPYGDQARQRLMGILVTSSFDLVAVDRDQYGRVVVIVELHDNPTFDTAQEAMVSTGFAWVDPQYCTKEHLCQWWGDLMFEAVENRRGLWRSKSEPIPPWVWRE